MAVSPKSNDKKQDAAADSSEPKIDSATDSNVTETVTEKENTPLPTSSVEPMTPSKNGSTGNEANQDTPATAAQSVADSKLEAKSSLTQGEEDYNDYTVMPESPWPPPIFIKRNIAPRERFYLENRWHSQWSYYDKRATENKDRYFTLQRIIVIGSVVVPALISFNPTLANLITTIFSVETGATGANAAIRTVVDTITVAISLSVAIAAALEGLNKYGENWSSYRSAAEELQAEKSFYDMQAGPYHNNPNPFSTFVERTEGIIAKQNGKYFEAVQQQLQQASQQEQEILDKYDESDDSGVTSSARTVSSTMSGSVG